MDDIVRDGYFRKSIAPAIAILLCLQIIMPLVIKSDGPAANATKVVVVEAIEPLKVSLRDLKSLNDNQSVADGKSTDAHQELAKALIKLAGSVERVAIAVERLDK